MKIILLTIFTCCTSCTINNEEIEKAVEICKSNKGLRCIYKDINEAKYYCNNGISFKLSEIEVSYEHKIEKKSEEK